MLSWIISIRELTSTGLVVEVERTTGVEVLLTILCQIGEESLIIGFTLGLLLWSCNLLGLPGLTLLQATTNCGRV
jgi:hypothetical protein